MAAKKSAKKSAKKPATRTKAAKKRSPAAKSAAGKTHVVLIESEHSKAKLAKAYPKHEFSDVELWVRKPDSTKKERLVTLARLCGQSGGACITAIEHD